MKNIYIAGKVSGLHEQEVSEKFENAKKTIEAMNYEVINPVELVKAHLNEFWRCKTLTDSDVWKIAMKVCIKKLVDCDGIVLLPDWQQSRGALLEVKIAEGLGIPIYDYSEFGLKFMHCNLI